MFIGVSLMSVNAQNYKINRLKYDYKMYIPEFGDPYNPTLMGIYSIIVPGLGQMLSGEISRGLVFFGGYLASAFVLNAGMNAVVSNGMDAGLNAESVAPTGIGLGLTLVGVVGVFGCIITSTVDAVKVAKVNNLYIRDYRKSSALQLEFSPYIGQFNIGNQVVTPVGMSMRISL